MRKNLRSVFEAASTFDDIMVDFKELQNEQALTRYVSSFSMKPQTKAGFIWQMSGNQVMTYLKSTIEAMEGTEYVEISKFDNVADVVAKAAQYHIYEDYDGAADDETSGFFLVNDFSRANNELVEFVLSLIGGRGTYHLADGWRVICTGNIDSGPQAWRDSYKRIFVNVEWAPKKRTVTDYENGDELDDSVKPAVKNQLKENLGGDVDKFAALLRKAYESGDLCRGCLVGFSKAGFEIKSPDEESDPAMERRYYWYPADKFVDMETGDVDVTRLFDALEREGIVESVKCDKTEVDTLLSVMKHFDKPVEALTECLNILKKDSK